MVFTINGALLFFVPIGLDYYLDRILFWVCDDCRNDY